MQEIKAAGTTYFLKTGYIESRGSGVNDGTFERHSAVIFADGEAMKNVIADGTIGSYLAPGIEGTFAFRKAPNEHWFFVGVQTAGGVRLADANAWNRDGVSRILASWKPLAVFAFMAWWTLAAISIGNMGWVLLAIGAALAFRYVALGIKDALNRFDVIRLAGMMRSWAAVQPA